MRKIILLVMLMVVAGKSFSQTTSPPTFHPENLKKLQMQEDSLRQYSDSMTFGDDDGLRSEACFKFIKKLVRALKTPQSFYYHFDSLKTISMVYSPDNKFRIITWGLLRHNGTYRYYGAIQMNTYKLDLFPLFDYSPLIRNVEDTVCTKDSWFGCMYYNIVPKIVGTKTYYTLFGWKAQNPRVVKKVMDILYFDKTKKPVFGAPLIYYTASTKPKTMNRFIIEFNKSATVSMNYNDEMQMVVFDNLVTKSEADGKPEKSLKPKSYEYFPDGTYEAFEWKNDRWEYVESLKNIQYKAAPTPVPFFDNKKSGGYMKTKSVQIPK